MKKVKKKKVNKYFLYTLLVVVSLTITYLIGTFISKEPNINNWYGEGRACYLIYSGGVFYLLKNRKKFF